MWTKKKGALGASIKHRMRGRFLIQIHEHGYISLLSHRTVPLLSVLLLNTKLFQFVLPLNRQAVSWEWSLQELGRDIIGFVTFTLSCSRVSCHNSQIFRQGLEAASQLVNTTPSSQVSWSDKYWICRPSKLTYLCKAKEWCIKFFPQVQILDLIFTIEHNLLRPIKSRKCRKKPHCISGQNPDTFRRRSNFPFDTLQVLILLWLKSDLLSLCLPMGMHLW